MQISDLYKPGDNQYLSLYRSHSHTRHVDYNGINLVLSATIVTSNYSRHETRLTVYSAPSQ